MKNQNAKRKSWSVLKAAVIGGLLFAGFSLAVLISVQRFGHSGELLGPDILIGLPTGIILQVVLHCLHIAPDGLGKWFYQNVALADLICSIVNGLLGAFLFAVVTCFRHFMAKRSAL